MKEPCTEPTSITAVTLSGCLVNCTWIHCQVGCREVSRGTLHVQPKLSHPERPFHASMHAPMVHSVRCRLSDRVQGFIPQNWSQFQDHILMLHTGCMHSAIQLLAAAAHSNVWRQAAGRCIAMSGTQQRLHVARCSYRFILHSYALCFTLFSSFGNIDAIYPGTS
jgi:hypothetical protein